MSCDRHFPETPSSHSAEPGHLGNLTEHKNICNYCILTHESCMSFGLLPIIGNSAEQNILRFFLSLGHPHCRNLCCFPGSFIPFRFPAQFN